ncbi:unnamed protein product [Orchesella dallaii]|uniref:Poly [ADP-ribose] polymerase n=1 Tax=Orchesella dallaii TaxID=48710 RepID=A0ABP1S8C7_9HEXA
MSQVSRKRKQRDVSEFGAHPQENSTSVRKPDKEERGLTEISSGNITKTKPVKRKKGEERAIEPLAKYFLQMIPNLITLERPIKSWLQAAKIVRPVNHMEYIHSLIMKYVTAGQVYGSGIQVMDIVEIRRVEDVAYEMSGDWTTKKRMLLWHGTVEENLASILINGLQIPPLRHQLFGAGIYFADRVAKSAIFCYEGKPDTKPYYLLLCDVLVGNSYIGLKPHRMLTSPPKNYDSVMGNGKDIPDPSETVCYKDMHIPLGLSVPNCGDLEECFLDDNEYAVYKPENVKPLYLVRFEFTPRPFCNCCNIMVE